MTAVDEVSALTQSIGEYAVQMVGKENLAELAVVLNPADLTARVSLVLKDNNEATQRDALEALFEVQELFFEDASMMFTFGHMRDMEDAEQGAQRQFQYA